MTLPLDGLFVLDLSRVRSGPTCAKQLCDWGANVVIVEPPEHVSPGDGMGGPRLGPDFQNLHRGKRSLTLDLKAERGREVLIRLARRADVLVENFRPGVMDRLGIGYEKLSQANPRLVWASITGFGQDGPRAGWPGFDQVAQGMGGMMSITGEPGKGPMRAGIPVADLSAGHFAVQAILLALLQRERTGRGQKVTTSLLEAQIAMLDFQAARWLVAGDIPGQTGNDHPTMAPMGVFPASDGYINIAAAGDHIWQRFCEVMGRDWAGEPAYADNESRFRNRGQLNAAISAETCKETMAVLVDRLNAAGVPAGPIHDIAAVFADPQVEHLGIARAMQHPELGQIAVVGQPYHLSDANPRSPVPAPGRGADSRAILEELGLSDDEIEALAAEGVT